MQTGEATRRMAMRLAHWKIPNTGEDCWFRAHLNDSGEQGLAKAGLYGREVQISAKLFYRLHEKCLFMTVS